MRRMEWKRGDVVGKGSFATVSLVAMKDQSLRNPAMVAKSAPLSKSSSLQKEKKILTLLRDCPQIVQCFGDEITVENHEKIYNLLLEYAPNGTLADFLKKSGGRLMESQVKHYTRSILKGLCFLQTKGYVHCDIKLQNILVFDDFEVKIADFGLSKAVGEEIGGYLIGTPLFMAPETVTRMEKEAPTDIWSLGCVISEMLSGKSVWNFDRNTEVCGALFKIGFGQEQAEIPAEISEQGKDFLKKCLDRNPEKRWTAEMLLNHPFLNCENKIEKIAESLSLSPRTAFDFPESCLMDSSSLSVHDIDLGFHGDSNSSAFCSSLQSVETRIHSLETKQTPNWQDNDEDWVDVRNSSSPVVESMIVIETSQMERRVRDKGESKSETMKLENRKRTREDEEEEEEEEEETVTKSIHKWWACHSDQKSMERSRQFIKRKGMNFFIKSPYISHIVTIFS